MYTLNVVVNYGTVSSWSLMDVKTGIVYTTLNVSELASMSTKPCNVSLVDCVSAECMFILRSKSFPDPSSSVILGTGREGGGLNAMVN